MDGGGQAINHSLPQDYTQWTTKHVVVYFNKLTLHYDYSECITQSKVVGKHLRDLPIDLLKEKLNATDVRDLQTTEEMLRELKTVPLDQHMAKIQSIADQQLRDQHAAAAQQAATGIQPLQGAGSYGAAQQPPGVVDMSAAAPNGGGAMGAAGPQPPLQPLTFAGLPSTPNSQPPHTQQQQDVKLFPTGAPTGGGASPVGPPPTLNSTNFQPLQPGSQYQPYGMNGTSVHMTDASISSSTAPGGLVQPIQFDSASSSTPHSNGSIVPLPLPPNSSMPPMTDMSTSTPSASSSMPQIEPLPGAAAMPNGQSALAPPIPYTAPGLPGTAPQFPGGPFDPAAAGVGVPPMIGTDGGVFGQQPPMMGSTDPSVTTSPMSVTSPVGGGLGPLMPPMGGMGPDSKRFARFKDDQLALLEQVHQDSPRPTKSKIMDLARVLLCTPKKIEMWFSNRRSKDKRHQQRLMTRTQMAMGPSSSQMGHGVGGMHDQDMTDNDGFVQPPRKVPRMKCPVCHTRCHVATSACPQCRHEFPKRQKTPRKMQMGAQRRSSLPEDNLHAGGPDGGLDGTHNGVMMGAPMHGGLSGAMGMDTSANGFTGADPVPATVLTTEQALAGGGASSSSGGLHSVPAPPDDEKNGAPVINGVTGSASSAAAMSALIPPPPPGAPYDSSAPPPPPAGGVAGGGGGLQLGGQSMVYCGVYNTQQGCQNQACPHVHECSRCSRSDHNEFSCPQARTALNSRPRPFECNVCQKRFPKPSILKRHMRVHTGEKPFQCAHCGKSFAHNQDKKRHEMSHTGERPFRCHLCHKGFIRRNNLTKHLQHHNQGRIPVTAAGGVPGVPPGMPNDPPPGPPSSIPPPGAGGPMPPPGSLVNGAITGPGGGMGLGMPPPSMTAPGGMLAPDGSGGPPSMNGGMPPVPGQLIQPPPPGGNPIMAATVAGMGMGMAQPRPTMAISQQRRSGPKNFACHFCDKRFDRNQNLIHHERIHTGEKPFECHVCHRKFTQEYHVQRHLKTHDKNKEKYMCDVSSCRRVFSWPKDLKEHKKYDHGNFVFACSECDAKFRRPSAVKRHMKRHNEKLSQTGQMPLHQARMIIEPAPMPPAVPPPTSSAVVGVGGVDAGAGAGPGGGVSPMVPTPGVGGAGGPPMGGFGLAATMSYSMIDDDTNDGSSSQHYSRISADNPYDTVGGLEPSADELAQLQGIGQPFVPPHMTGAGAATTNADGMPGGGGNGAVSSSSSMIPGAPPIVPGQTLPFPNGFMSSPLMDASTMPPTSSSSSSHHHQPMPMHHQPTPTPYPASSFAMPTPGGGTGANALAPASSPLPPDQIQMLHPPTDGSDLQYRTPTSGGSTTHSLPLPLPSNGHAHTHSLSSSSSSNGHGGGGSHINPTPGVTGGSPDPFAISPPSSAHTLSERKVILPTSGNHTS